MVSPGTPVFSTNKTDHNITVILLKVALNTINPIFSARYQKLILFHCRWAILLIGNEDILMKLNYQKRQVYIRI
jgi:hypothetical protein